MVTHAAGLRGAAGGVRLGVEVHDDGLAAEVRELDRATVLVGQLEVRCVLSLFDHLASTGARQVCLTRCSLGFQQPKFHPEVFGRGPLYLSAMRPALSAAAARACGP